MSIKQLTIGTFIIAATLAGSCASAAFWWMQESVPATITLGRFLTGEQTDRVIEATAVNLDGYIDGSTKSGMVQIPFREIAQITYDASLHEHVVQQIDGTTVKLAHGRLVAHYTSPTFNYNTAHPKSGAWSDESEDQGRISSIVFHHPAPKPPHKPATKPKPTSDSPEAQIPDTQP
ncbi:hypothetical protein KBA41_15830 [Candidatus Ozemobacteraceae bacterium]|nr:hypothetical protein [Candidatus Ozemobacteraceae bacterium]